VLYCHVGLLEAVTRLLASCLRVQLDVVVWRQQASTAAAVLPWNVRIAVYCSVLYCPGRCAV